MNNLPFATPLKYFCLIQLMYGKGEIQAKFYETIALT